MFTFAQTLVNAIAVTPVLALTSLGFVVILRATGVFNFAQGYLVMVGAYLSYAAVTQAALPVALALPLVVVASAALGGLIYLVVLRPLSSASHFAQVIVTLGIAIMLSGMVAIIWGFSPLRVAIPGAGQVVRLPGGLNVTVFNIAAIVVTLVYFGALVTFLGQTDAGLRMRAVAENPVLATRRAISITRTSTAAWMIAGAGVGLAGIVLAGTIGANPAIANIGLRAFPAIILGGFDSIRGSLIGAFLISLIAALTVVYLGARLEDVVVFGLMLIVLMVRPFGIFGTPEARRV